MKLNKLSSLVAVLGLSMAVGCSGEDEDKGYGEPIGGTAEQSAATGTIDSILSLQSVGAGDETDVDSVMAAFGDMGTLLNAKLAAESGSGSPYGVAPREGNLPRLDRILPRDITVTDFDDACVTTSGDTVTYNQCTWLFGTVDGWITVRPGYLATDITVTFEDEDTSLAITMQGELEATATRLAGDLHYEIDASQNGVSDFVYRIDAELDVALTNGCATGGYLEIHADIDGYSGGYTVDYDVWVRADFGPACGQVTIY